MSTVTPPQLNTTMPAPGFDRITAHPKQINGRPCIRNMRLTLRRVVEAVSVCPNREDLFREYPVLEENDIRRVHP